MGNTLWFRVEATESPLNREDDRSFLEHAAERLDALAGELGVTPLTAFFDYSELAAEYAEDVDVPGAEWFEPADGLATARALLRRLDSTVDAELLEDLAAWQAFLEQVAAVGLRFNLLVLP